MFVMRKLKANKCITIVSLNYCNFKQIIVLIKNHKLGMQLCRTIIKQQLHYINTQKTKTTCMRHTLNNKNTKTNTYFLNLI